MERLTFEGHDGGMFVKGSAVRTCIVDDEIMHTGNAVRKLAEYEEIGLLTEQLMEIDKLYAEKCKELAKIQKEYLSGMELLQIYAELKQLKRYKCLEERCFKENGVGIEIMLMKVTELKTEINEYKKLEEQGKMTDMQKKALKLKEDIERACIENGLNLTIHDEKIGFVDHKEGKIIMLWEPVYSDHD